MVRSRIFLVLLASTAVLGLAGCSDGPPATFEGLTADQRVYDTTGDSLDAAETDALERRLAALNTDTGADVVAYVRDLDADSDDTLEQVESLHGQWATAAGIDPDTAGAILINREPGTDDEARAGIFVGTTFDQGNVPGDEQEAIVDDALIPPLRDGDVAGSLTAGIDRLESSIVNGPPVTAVDEFAAGPGSTWLPWAGVVTMLVGLGAVAVIFRRRATPTVSKQSPTIHRPDHRTDAAIGTTLVHRTFVAGAMPATVLSLAAADALALEPEDKAVRVRLLDESKVRGEIQRSVWDTLTEHAEDGVVDSAGLTKVAAGTGATKNVVDARMRADGWLAEGTAAPRATMAILGILGGVAMVGGGIVAASGAPLMVVTAVLGFALLVAGVLCSAMYSRFSVAGRDAARPWEAYRDGLKEAAKDESDPVDLDDALPDIVALGLGGAYRKQLEKATDPSSGTPLRAFTSPTGADATVLNWVMFSTIFTATNSSSGGTVSGGSTGGGGAAGST